MSIDHSRSRTVFFQSCLGVFQGGGCRAAAFAGAVAESVDWGVDFVGLAGTSAGSIVAAFLGAGASPDQLLELLAKLKFADLLVQPEQLNVGSPPMRMRIAGLVGSLLGFEQAADLVRRHGMHSSRKLEEWVNEELKKLLPDSPSDRVKFRDLVKPTWIVAADIFDRDVKVWSTDDTPIEEVANAVRCSCSIPVFFQPVNNRYVDGGMLSNLPAFVFTHDDSRSTYANRILAYTLKSAKKATAPEDAKSLLLNLVNTVVDGATRVQARLLRDVHEIRIPTGDVEATDFAKMTPEAVQMLVNNGRQAARSFFSEELSQVRTSSMLSNFCDGDDEVYGVLTESMANGGVESVVFCDSQPRFIYPIYPSILNWRLKGVAISAVLETAKGGQHDGYQRRLLRALGIPCAEVPSLPYRGVLLDPEHHSKAQAVIYIPDAVGGRSRAVHYRAPEDFEASRALFALLPKSGTVASSLKIDLERDSENIVIDKLKKHVPPYAQAKLSMETIPLGQLTALSKLVRGYKYQQIAALHKIFAAAEFHLFEPAQVNYGSGRRTIVTPPVVEQTGNQYILVQGTTRAVYTLRRGFSHIRCLVVNGPSAPLPGRLRVPLARVLIGGRTLSTRDRYEQDIDKDYRHIEQATHHPDETLTDI